MDVNLFHSILTVLATLVFAGIVFWAYSGRSKKHFEQAAWSVLRDEHADDGEGVRR
jgi:cytochrome c oxidase cbb3-type subunit IV